MKLLLLGAGHIGHTIAALLEHDADIQLTVADRDPARLALIGAGSPSHATQTLDISDAAALRQALEAHDAVINALPFHAAMQVAAAAKAAGAHYFDLTEDTAATRHILELATDAKTVLMPQCGLAPGFVGIVGHDLAMQFASDDQPGSPLQLEALHMRVGALPRYPTNALKYNLTWSTDGLINEYCNPCDAISHGQRVLVPALDGHESFALDGVEYEAFNTSGGLGTLCDTLAGQVRNLDYKSIRYPGHGAIMKLLLNDLRLRDRRELLRGIFETAIPTTSQDVVLVFVTASGFQRGEFVQQSFTAHIHGRELVSPNASGTKSAANEHRHHSAIQITTAAGVLAAVDMVRTGALAQHGFVRQEDVRLSDFKANRFGSLYFTNATIHH